jgi:hypothetical protein
LPTLTAPPAARAAIAARPAVAPKTVHHVPPKPGGRLRLTAKAFKVTLVVDGTVLADYTVPERDRPRVTIAAGGRTVTAELNPKSLKKAIATIREHGAEAVAVVLQGNLGPGDVLDQAGISAQLKGPRP